LQKESASRDTQIRFTNLAIPFRERGVGHRHERWDGMRWTRQRRARRRNRRAGFSSGANSGAQTNGDASVFAKASVTCTHAEASGRRRVADGEAVWSWHPLLVSSRRRCCEPDRVCKAVNSSTTVTKRNSSPGRARSKPLKPLRRECRLIPVNLWRRPCAFFCTRAAGASDTRHSLRPLF
jgi:hypothetical protein